MIKSKKIIIKILEKKHLEKLRLLRNHPETNYYLTSIMPISEHGQEEWFKNISLDKSKMYFAIENPKGKFLGMARCDEWDKINRSIRAGVDIVPEFRRHGYATKAYRLLFEFLFSQLGLNRVWLLVAEYNRPAFALYKKLGFKVEGKQREALFRNNQFNDYIMMSLLKREYEKKRQKKKSNSAL